MVRSPRRLLFLIYSLLERPRKERRPCKLPPPPLGSRRRRAFWLQWPPPARRRWADLVARVAGRRKTQGRAGGREASPHTRSSFPLAATTIPMVIAFSRRIEFLVCFLWTESGPDALCLGARDWGYVRWSLSGGSASGRMLVCGLDSATVGSAALWHPHRRAKGFEPTTPALISSCSSPSCYRIYNLVVPRSEPARNVGCIPIVLCPLLLISLFCAWMNLQLAVWMASKTSTLA